eukprot:1133005-Rhodomonas_salina.3
MTPAVPRISASTAFHRGSSYVLLPTLSPIFEHQEQRKVEWERLRPPALAAATITAPPIHPPSDPPNSRWLWQAQAHHAMCECGSYPSLASQHIASAERRRAAALPIDSQG